MPGHFKVFCSLHRQQPLEQGSRRELRAAQKALDKPNVVLPAHSVTLDGEPASAEPNFDSDAGRGPFRVSTDYAWYRGQPRQSADGGLQQVL